MPDNIETTFLRLRPDCRAERLPFDQHFWPNLMAGKLGSFHKEYLLSFSEFAADWPSWEIHPNGDEIVFLLSGKAIVLLERDGTQRTEVLQENGDYVLVPQGTWHTAKTQCATRLLFITAGEGTVGRPVA